MNDPRHIRHVVSNPAQARRAVRDALEVGHSGLVDDALLLTSEVVTNAMMHAGSAATRVAIVVAGQTVRIEVADDSPTAPHVEHHHVDSMIPGGYGVSIVDSIASRWGIEPHPGDGKTVWFELA